MVVRAPLVDSVHACQDTGLGVKLELQLAMSWTDRNPSNGFDMLPRYASLQKGITRASHVEDFHSPSDSQGVRPKPHTLGLRYETRASQKRPLLAHHCALGLAESGAQKGVLTWRSAAEARVGRHLFLFVGAAPMLPCAPLWPVTSVAAGGY